MSGSRSRAGASRSQGPREVLAGLWRELEPGGGEAPVVLRAPMRSMPALPTAFRVSDAAAAAVGLALAEAALLRGSRQPAVLDVGAAVEVFAAERRLRVDGRPPPLWDPLGGDHRAADGWVRLHTNYHHHRAAALRALGLDPGLRAEDAVRAEDVARAVLRMPAHDVEEAVHARGGAAAALRTAQAWHVHPQAAAVAARPLLAVDLLDAPGGARPRDHVDPPVPAAEADPGAPGRRLRVLDLTRVIAGPTATKVLAALGADVLRLDPPGFEEVPGVVADMTAGKRCARLDLRTGPGRERFAALLRAADVLVCGLRPGALDRLGWSRSALAAANPRLVLAELSAYGDTGPWAGRRGFDSLVQTVCGIADEGRRRARGERPLPLPLQALDHASGWLLAAGVLAAVRRRAVDGRGRTVGVVLARTAQWLDELGRDEEHEDAARPGRAEHDPAALLETVPSALGPVTRVRCPGELDGRMLGWGGPPSALGAHEPAFAGTPDLPSGSRAVP